jgi:DNA-binding SARP family transcriptional activator/tetratricopeptide (TPR) repeat protein
MESALPGNDGELKLTLLGPLAVSRKGAPCALPASRKLRALLAYLILAPQSVGRAFLCELLWDVPNDPRGELRWCLSKLRGLLDEAGRERVVTADDKVAIDLKGCAVDVVEISAAIATGLEKLGASRLGELSALFTGDFLEGLEVDRCPDFAAWLMAQRRRFRAWHVAVLEHLVACSDRSDDETFVSLEKWIALAPFDRRAHLGLLTALAERGRLQDGDEHLAATVCRFDAEGMDIATLREEWRRIRTRTVSSVRTEPITPFEPAAQRRRALAIMPFIGEAKSDGLTQDIITRLAKLRSFAVIARGSVAVLAERGVEPVEAGRRLEADYVASGTLSRRSGRFVVTVELAETRNARIVWTEVFDEAREDTFRVLEEIGARIVSAIAGEIEAAERGRAVLKPPASLDAWEAYHRGLWHMYRFTKDENDQARHFFETAVRLDPAYSRAYAGLSFTHWQSAFQRWADRKSESELAYKAAGRGLIADEHDPAAHWAMGRALWLKGGRDDAMVELRQAVELSPSFALGHYALSFVGCQSGDPREAIGSSDHSRSLSPFDPLLFGMLGTRALAHVRLGEFDEAADWALKAAGRPNAHATIQAIAACCLALAGRIEEGRIFAATIRRTLPAYGFEDFRTTFQFPADVEGLFRQGARRIGLE